MMRPIRAHASARWVRMALGAACVVLIGYLLWHYYVTIPAWGNVPFDSSEWKAVAHQQDKDIRGKMLRSLLLGRSIRGLTRSEVAHLLGEPDSQLELTSSGKKRPGSEPAHSAEYWYDLGYHHGFGIDLDFLVVCFSEDGKVRAWRVHRD
jgi:hypothetical protein